MNRRQLLCSVGALPSLGAALSAAAEQKTEVKITGVETDLLKPPPGEPVYDALQTLNDGDLSRFKRQVTEAIGQGYKAVKIKVGKYSLDDDIRRIRLALDIIGKERRLMVDANQVFDRKEALRRGRVYQEMGCFWYEEPLPPHDMEGFALLAEALDIRIATGENLNTKYTFADLIARRGADVVQPDNRRAGGVSEWMEIAAIADGYGVEVASHGGGATNLNMLLAMPNAIYMETGGPVKMIDGEVLAPEEPGMSSEVSAGEIRKYRVG